MAITRKPKSPVSRSYVPPNSIPYKVKTGDNLKNISKKYGLTWQELTEYNWKTHHPPEVNWYLGNYVGCTAETSDKKNYSFRSTDNPGIIHVPRGASVSPAVTRSRREDTDSTTINRIVPPVLIVKIPLGGSRTVSKAKTTIGKIYIPTKWGGTLSIKASAGTVQLFYNNGKDIDNTIEKQVMAGQHLIKSAAGTLNYAVPDNKHGWYYVRVRSTQSANVSNTFTQEGQATDRPWNGWYCPTEPNTNPNLYENSGVFTPLKKYDAKFGTSTRTWEATNHVGTLGWEGHCWGWSLACIALKTLKLASSGFTKWEIRGLYTELADNANSGWTWKIGSPSNEIPSGPVTDNLGEGPDKWVKKFHDGIRTWIGRNKRALNADLRNDKVGLRWHKVAGVEQKINGVTLRKANCSSGHTAQLKWDSTASTLKLHDGSAVAIPSNGTYTLSCSFGVITVSVNKTLLPASNATGRIRFFVEVWNHAIYKYVATFKEEQNENDVKYVEIEMKITGNRDTPFPPSETSTVGRKFTYRLSYNSSGDTIRDKQNWVSCHGALPPSCMGIVNDESSFGWHANCGITKSNVDTL
jgi:hypothetical protein